MEQEGIPLIRITHVESGHELTLDPNAARNLMLNLEIAVERLSDQDAFLKGAAASGVLDGLGTLIDNEHGAIWLAFGFEGRLLPPPESSPPP